MLLSHLTTDSSQVTRAGGGGAGPAADHLAVQPRLLVAVRPLEPVQRLQPDPGEVCEELLVLDTALKHPHEFDIETKTTNSKGYERDDTSHINESEL